MRSYLNGNPISQGPKEKWDSKWQHKRAKNENSEQPP